MELIETTPEQAASLIESKKRKISIGITGSKNEYIAEWINLNNQTCYGKLGNNGSMFFNEDITFYINVPASAKTVY